MVVITDYCFQIKCLSVPVKHMFIIVNYRCQVSSASIVCDSCIITA